MTGVRHRKRMLTQSFWRERMVGHSTPGMNSPHQPSAPASADAWYALLASFLGWTLDAFDFFLLVFVVPAVAKEFGESIPSIAAAISLTLAMRPVGAFIFGLLADRYGRRLPLMI